MEEEGGDKLHNFFLDGVQGDTSVSWIRRSARCTAKFGAERQSDVSEGSYATVKVPHDTQDSWREVGMFFSGGLA